MKKGFWILLCILILTCHNQPLGPDSEPIIPKPTTINLDDEITLLAEFDENLMLELLNKEREKHHLEPMIIDDRLRVAAQKHALWMADNKKMSHTGENRSSPATRIKNEKLDYKSCAENIAYGQEDESEVTTGWIHSSGHHRNMLSSNELVGFGGAKSASGAMYWVQLFASEDQ